MPALECKQVTTPNYIVWKCSWRAYPTMAALPLMSSAVLLNLTGPRLMPSLGLPNALQECSDASDTAHPILGTPTPVQHRIPCDLTGKQRLSLPRPEVARPERTSSLGHIRSSSGLLVEEAANHDQAIRPQICEGESIELAPHTDTCPQLSKEAKREANHCTAVHTCLMTA